MARIAAALPEPTSHHVLWVTHAGVERAVSLLMQGVCCPSRADQWPRKGLGFGEWRGW
jgi:alpha-ribazole phosphatase